MNYANKDNGTPDRVDESGTIYPNGSRHMDFWKVSGHTNYFLLEIEHCGGWYPWVVVCCNDEARRITEIPNLLKNWWDDPFDMGGYRWEPIAEEQVWPLRKRIVELWPHGLLNQKYGQPEADPSILSFGSLPAPMEGMPTL